MVPTGTAQADFETPREYLVWALGQGILRPQRRLWLPFLGWCYAILSDRAQGPLGPRSQGATYPLQSPRRSQSGQ